MLLSLHCTILCDFLYKHVYLLASLLASQKADLHLVVFFHFLMAMRSLNTLHLKIMIFFFFRLMMQTEKHFATDQSINTFLLQHAVASHNLSSVSRSHFPFKKSSRSPTTGEGAVVGFGTHTKRSSSYQWNCTRENYDKKS